jgi:hypothetical protein
MVVTIAGQGAQIKNQISGLMINKKFIAIVSKC